MRFTKHGHACIQVDHDGSRVIVDPGDYTPNAAELLATADAVLVTHAHGDHLSLDALRAALRASERLTVRGPSSVADALGGEFGDRVLAVAPGEEFDVAGVHVSVHGGLHAAVLPSIPRVPNVGYLFGGLVYHPGDSVEHPGIAVDTLLVPISAPWLKLSEAAHLIEDVSPRRAVAIHDAFLSRTGLDLVERLLGTGGASPVPIEQFAQGEAFADGL